MPLSQTLITPDLALAFDIPLDVAPIHSPPPPPSFDPNSSNLNSSTAASGPGVDEPACTLKRPRLVWRPQLHKRFIDAVVHLGIKNAVPKTIMQLMSVDGLTHGNVASHLQKLFMPHQFLGRGQVAGHEPFLPYVLMATLQHHQQIAALQHHPVTNSSSLYSALHHLTHEQ